MTPKNVIAGFRRTGIYPFNPEEHKKSLQEHGLSAALEGIPLLFFSAHALLSDSAAVSALTAAVAGPPPAPTSTAVKRKVRRTLNTAAGVLLTGAQVMWDMKKWEEAKKAEAERLERERQRRVTRRAEVAVEKAAKEQRRAVREAAKAAKAAKAAAAASAASAASAAASDEDDGSDSAAGNKENSHPNLPPGDGGVGADSRQKCAVAAVVKRATGAVLRLRAIR